MSDPVDFIDAEKLLTRLEALEQRAERIEGLLREFATLLGVRLGGGDA